MQARHHSAGILTICSSAATLGCSLVSRRSGVAKGKIEEVKCFTSLPPSMADNFEVLPRLEPIPGRELFVTAQDHVEALQQKIRELKSKLQKQRDNTMKLSKYLDLLNVENCRCDRCGWIDIEKKFRKCSGVLCCEECKCETGCCEDASDAAGAADDEVNKSDADNDEVNKSDAADDEVNKSDAADDEVNKSDTDDDAANEGDASDAGDAASESTGPECVICEKDITTETMLCCARCETAICHECVARETCSIWEGALNIRLTCCRCLAFVCQHCIVFCHNCADSSNVATYCTACIPPTFKNEGCTKHICMDCGAHSGESGCGECRFIANTFLRHID